MNKIFNWMFGACFRTLGRFLAIFIVFALLLFIGSKLDLELPSWLGLKINASSYYNFYTNNSTNINQPELDILNGSAYTATGLNLPSRTMFYDCNGYTSCNTTISKTDYTGGTVALGITTATNGFAVSHDLNTLYSKDQLYSYTAFMCTSANYINTADFKLYLNTGVGTASDKYSYPADVYFSEYRMSQSYYWTHYGISGGWSQSNMRCYQFTYIFKSHMNSSTFTNRFWFNSMSNINYNFVGYKLDSLGYVGNLSKEDVQNIINNSGLATSTSVEQVNQSVNQVKQEVQELNNSIDETNNNIMNSDSPDVSGMTDLAGYLPPGPLDSVLNLPLSILNSLNTKLSSSCTPLTLTLPFVNLPLNIPCLSTIFSQIAGLNILWETIGVILGALIMYKYLVYLYNWVDDVTSLKHNRARLFGAKSDADNWGGVE